MLILVISIYIILATGLNQFYKLTTRTAKNIAAQTVGLLLIAGFACLLFIPFFEIKFPQNPWTYLLWGLSCIFFALNNRMIGDVRKNLEASVIGILQQSYTVLMTLAGFVLFGDHATFSKVLGILLIIGGNILMFWRHGKTGRMKYIWLGLLAYTCNVVAELIDVSYSGEFNMPFYVSFSYLIPALFVFVSSRIRVSDIVAEYKRANKRNYIITSFCWSMHYVILLIAYSISEVSVVAPLSSLAIFSNVIVGYFWLKEKDKIAQKIIATILAILGVVLIAL